MSQSGPLSIVSGGGPVIETITGNSGGAVGPDGSFNINFVGNNATGINIVGNPGTNTLTANAYLATTIQQGTLFLATNAQAIAGINGTNAIVPSSLAAKLGTQTAHSLAVFEGTAAALTALGVAGNGVLPIGSAGADPVLANITSSGGTITITNGPGSISLDVTGGKVGETITGDSGGALSPTAGNWNIIGGTVAAGSSPLKTAGSVSTLTINSQISQAIASTDATKIGLAAFDSADFTVDGNGFVSAVATGFIKTITGNSGGAESPSANNFNIVGTGSITVAGSANTETVQLTGLTNHAVLVGAGSATITKVGPSGSTGQVLQNNAAADPSYSTATYPSTTTINQILYSSSANVVGGLATANQGVLTTGATGIPVITALATNGQLIIGSTAGVPAAATLSAGTGISIANGSNSITISATGTTTLNYTAVNHAASPYTVLSTDDYLGVTTSAGVVSILLPNAPATGRVLIIKDTGGTAATHAITVTTVGGAVNIDGATSYTISTNYEAIEVIFNGAAYEVF